MYVQQTTLSITVNGRAHKMTKHRQQKSHLIERKPVLLPIAVEGLIKLRTRRSTQTPKDRGFNLA